jgi:hypothetical protein
MEFQWSELCNSIPYEDNYFITYYGLNEASDYFLFLLELNTMDKYRLFVKGFQNLLEDLLFFRCLESINYIEQSILMGVMTCHLTQIHTNLIPQLLNDLFIFRNEMEYLDIITRLADTFQPSEEHDAFLGTSV